MAMCRSGLLLCLNAKSSNCVVRKPRDGARCQQGVFVEMILGRENANDNAIMLPATLKATFLASIDERRMRT